MKKAVAAIMEKYALLLILVLACCGGVHFPGDRFTAAGGLYLLLFCGGPAIIAFGLCRRTGGKRG